MGRSPTNVVTSFFLIFYLRDSREIQDFQISIFFLLKGQFRILNLIFNWQDSERNFSLSNPL